MRKIDDIFYDLWDKYSLNRWAQYCRDLAKARAEYSGVIELPAEVEQAANDFSYTKLINVIAAHYGVGTSDVLAVFVDVYDNNFVGYVMNQTHFVHPMDYSFPLDKFERELTRQTDLYRGRTDNEA